MKFATLLLLLCALASVALAKLAPPQSAFDKCKSIGQSSGCSGCTSEFVDCGWCTSPTSQLDGVCAPDGFCDHVLDSNQVPMVSADKICPSNPMKEPKFSSQGLDSGAAIEGIFTKYFDSHYCQFPVQPWPVDRTSDPFGNRNPPGNCRRANNQLGLGQRGLINSCLQKKENLDGNRLTPKRLECLSVSQSYLCTVSCPAYGAAIDFNNVCSDYCERIMQHCDEAISACIVDSGGVDLREYFSCAAPGATDCSRPQLIPTAGKFEYDMCFFGDINRCRASDCEVELAVGSKWPAYFQDTALWRRSNRVNFNPDQLGPACDYHDDWDIDSTGKALECCSGHIGLLYRVKSIGTPDGTSCWDATYNTFLKDFTAANYPPGGQVGILSIDCTPDVDKTVGGFCAVSTESEIYQTAFPEGLNQKQTRNCPAVITSSYRMP